MASGGKEDQPGQGMLTGGLVNYDCYEVADNRYIMVGALEDRFFQNFLKQLDDTNFSYWWKNKTLSMDEFKSKLSDYLKSKSMKDLEHIFNNPDCCVTPVLSIKEALNHPHFNKKGLIREFQGKKYLGSPFYNDDIENEMVSAPSHGQHTDIIYRELLNFSQEQIKKYRDGRII